MILKTGNKGFTLIEVLIATAILSLGSVLIYQAFFISLDSFNYCSNYLNVSAWLDEKVWQAQDDLSRLGPSANIPAEGNYINRNKDFKWNLSYEPIDGSYSLYKINALLSWQEGRRGVKLSRSAYALYEKK